jgi:hypothetical protein
MPAKMRFGVFGGAVALVCVAMTANAAVLPYRFDKVAETGSTYSALNVPALNDAGVVAFVANQVGNTSPGVYFGNQFLVQPVNTAPVGNVSWPNADINNLGQVAFVAKPTSNPNNFIGIDGVYRADALGITTIAPPWSAIDTINGGPVINNAGTVGFSVFGTVVSRMYTGTGGPLSTTATSSGGIADPRLNNQGKAAAILTAGTGPTVFYDGAPIISQSTSYADPDFIGVGGFSVNHIDLGDNDRVAFAARWNNMTDAFYLWQNGTITKVAGTNGLLGIPAVNDLGTVAGLVTGGGSTRLSIFQNGGEDTLISVGSPFDGSTITGLSFSPEGFNNANQLAFLATLADGRSVSVIAGLPEPGAASLVIGCAGLLLRRRTRVYRT